MISSTYLIDLKKQGFFSVHKATTLLKSMCSEHRMMILCLLINCERSVSDLQEQLGLNQAAVSQHLSRLRKDKLVKTKRVRKHIYYRLASHEVSTTIKLLYKLYCRTDTSGLINYKNIEKKIISLQ